MEDQHERPATASLVTSDLRLLRYQADLLQAENEYLLQPKKFYPALGRLPHLPKPIREFYWTTTRFVGLAFLHDGTWQAKKERLSRLFRKSTAEHKTLSLLPCDGGLEKSPRILVDVSATAASRAQTGIQRYVREFARAAFATGAARPVCIQSDRIFDAYRDPARTTPLGVEPKDTLLMLDSNWRSDQTMTQFLTWFKSLGGRVVVFFHDIVPLRFPYTCQQTTVARFTAWFEMITCYADAYITSTQAGAKELAVAVQAFSNRERPIGWVPAGTSLSARQTCRASDKITDFFRNGDRAVFLSVGTMEPRKGYAIALAAFEDLWSNGHDLKYLIIGAHGWGMRGFEQKIRKHSKYGTHLLWIADASDTDLRFAYMRAAALVAPSIAEGFGMPIIEAAEFGVPMILSDIPVFREITKDLANYFEVGNAQALAQAVKSFESHRTGDRDEIKGISWIENVTRMTQMIRNGTYQWPSNSE